MISWLFTLRSTATLPTFLRVGTECGKFSSRVNIEQFSRFFITKFFLPGETDRVPQLDEHAVSCRSWKAANDSVSVVFCFFGGRHYARETDMMNIGGVLLRPFHLTFSASCGMKGLIEPATRLSCQVYVT